MKIYSANMYMYMYMYTTFIKHKYLIRIKPSRRSFTTS